MSYLSFGLFILAIGIYILLATTFILRRRSSWNRNILGLRFTQVWFKTWLMLAGSLAASLGILVMLRIIPLQ